MGWFRRSASEGEEASASSGDRLASIEPGVPGHCPACDGLGYIDDLHIGHRYQIQHCKDCGHRWEYLFDTDGHVVGLTELDELGQPVARMRVRTRPLVADRVPASDAPAAEVVDLSSDEVIDLRAPAEDRSAAPAGAADETDHMSPAEWIRHALGR